MGLRFQTLGNASVIVFAEDRPVLATDPWLIGTCYHGSWALDHDLTESEIRSFETAPWIWISHGHPDHLHEESLELLSRNTEILVPDHYTSEMEEFLRDKGFTVRVLAYREWVDLGDGVRVLCLQNDNQDAMLCIEAGDALIVDMNDAPPSGEQRFLRRLARRYEQSFLLAICSNDADLFNTYSQDGVSLVGPPDEKKPGTVLSICDLARFLGVTHFCCSSSQHVYVRKDSAWANPHRITWRDMERNWHAPGVELVEPFVTFDLETGTYVADNPGQPDRLDRVSDACHDDDWSEPLTDEEWSRISAFFGTFPLLPRRLDWLKFTVGGETRTLQLGNSGRPPTKQRGITFEAPRTSLVRTIDAGYFDDLLIGNFIRARLHNASLYPDFTPIVAKLGGNAKVFTKRDLRRFRAHYFRMSPYAWVAWRLRVVWLEKLRPAMRGVGRRSGLLEPLKRLERVLFRRSPLPREWPPSGNDEGDRIGDEEHAVGSGPIDDDRLNVRSETGKPARPVVDPE